MAAIICRGTAVRDFVFSVPSLPPTPQKLTASALRKSSGGMAATAAIAAAALGGSVAYWGRLGADDTGRELRAELESYGVQVHAPTLEGTESAVAAVLVADNGERMLAVFRGRVEDSTDWLPLDNVASVQATCFMAHTHWRWRAAWVSSTRAGLRLPRPRSNAATAVDGKRRPTGRPSKNS